MARPLSIRISFAATDYPDFTGFVVPPYDEQREVLLEARVGDTIAFSHEGKKYFGTVFGRHFSRGDTTLPELPDSSWSIDIDVKH
ncbi:hypothetical protein [Pseudomonas brassicacearum]|uniref:hypothetical protein n=1 Tax=Pseudomonas brassicacearum TaxID=930166 RepID=UPI001182A7D5|nr:hypothetical protein [Pseudomonas brassicacearum]